MSSSHLASTIFSDLSSLLKFLSQEWSQLDTNESSLTKEIETSCSKFQPLSGWDLHHALRELWQNLTDGISATFIRRLPPDNNFRIVQESRKLFKAFIDDYEIASIDLTQEDTIEIFQLYCILNEQALQLSSTKTDLDIGGHGEGMKNAINILLRNGFEVSYLIPRRIWTFFFKEEKNHALCVQVAPHQNNQPGLLIRIKGPNAHEIGFLFNPADYLALTGLTSCWDCLDGSIFICTSQNPNHDRS